jgi:DNA-binding MarR family transcriptional regulator
MLVDAGYDFDAILSLFLKYPCAGKFKERDAQDPDKAIRQYLYPTFLSAQRIAQVKQTARTAMQWAISHAWRGKTGAIDRAVFIAHCELAEHAGRIEYHASSRDLAERAHVGHRTATRATHRLKQGGLVQLVKPNIKGESLANLYKLVGCIMSPLSNPVKSGSVCNAEKHDAFWARGLGKSAGQCFELLRRESLTVKELAERTGRTRQTVWRNLKKMSRIADPRTGEIIAIVHRDGNKWRARADVDLDYIARCVGTQGKAERQRTQHARERKDFRARVKLKPRG